DLVIAGQGDRLRTVPGLGDDLQVRLPVEDEPYAAPHQGMVVGEQDPDRRGTGAFGAGRGVLGHDCFLRTGTVSRLLVPAGVVPAGAAGTMSSVAPTSRARSRMPRMPAPSWAAPTPRPSSLTSSTTFPPSAWRLTSTFCASACRAALVSPSCATR